MPKRLFLLAIAAVLMETTATAPAAARQALHGHVPAAVQGQATLARLDASKHLGVAIGLPLRNSDELADLLRQLYDPASPNYRQYLTPEQFAERFGPTEADYQAAIDFAKSNGLTVACTHPNRVVLDVEGAVTNIETAFHVTMRVYQHPTEARTFFAPDAEPSLDLAVPVLHISGLDNYSLPHTNSRRKPAAQATPSSGSGPGGGYVGDDFRNAYIPGVTLDGSGQSVGLLQFDGFYASDITAYEALAGRPNIPVQVVPVDGGVSTITSAGSGEVSLDIEMVIAMAPGVSSIIVYEAPNPSPWVDLLNRMATDNRAKQLSCSWSGGSHDATAEQIFRQMAAQGQTFFNATGDSDAFTGSISFPSDSTNIVEVGGTTLTTTGPGGSYAAETVWNLGLYNGSYVGSSGGISTYFALPGYQRSIDMTANQGSTTLRNVPDVAMVADNVYVIYFNGQSGAFGGTSCAAPLWAGFTALINQQAAASGQAPVGFLNPALYAIGQGSGYAAAFHDITSGNNFSSASPAKFSAVPGYDLCTGWGTPAGSNLINALAPWSAFRITPGTGFVSTGFVGGPFSVTLQSYALTNAGAAPIGWAAGTTSSWLTVSSAGGLLPPGGATGVTVGVNAAAGGLAAGTYAATLVFTNLTDSTAQSRQFTLQIAPTPGGISLIQNGDFETGDFSGWTLSGNSSYLSVSTLSSYVHSPTHGARMRPSGSLGYLGQTLATEAGRLYLLSFWLDNPLNRTPNEFLVTWDGNTLYDRANMGAVSWTNLQFMVTATGASTLLQFGFRNDRSSFGFDDVSVVPLQCLLTVVAGNGSAYPGTVLAGRGTVVNESVTNSPVTVGPGVQQVCVGAVVGGNAYTQVDPTHVTLILTNDATLAWAWQTNYAIVATAGLYGAISPSGTVWVTANSNQAFAITASPLNAAIGDVVVDGGSIGATNGYVFSSVAGSHTIQALFQVVYPAAGGYSLSGSSITVSDGFVFSWTPASAWLYTLQATPQLAPSAWSNIPPYTNMAGAGLLTVTNGIGPASSMFYRLMAVPAN